VRRDGNKKMWCEKHDCEGKIWEDESVGVFKGVSKKTVKNWRGLASRL
jgi:hypothetical protein